MASWAADAVRLGWENREEAKGVIEWAKKYLLGDKTTIAVTGMAGSGKSVLSDHMCGEGQVADYKVPGRSQKLEHKNVRHKRQRLRLKVIPGEESPQRSEAVTTLLAGKKAVDGIIHVTSYGFATIRDQAARRILERDPRFQTIQQIRAEQMRIELEDLRSTCRLIEQSHKDCHRPTWLILAVNKIDLYLAEHAEAQEYYEGPGAIQDELRVLRDSVGSSFFRWECAPVCSRIEKYEWNGQIVPSAVDDGLRNAYLCQFLSLIRDYSK